MSDRFKAPRLARPRKNVVMFLLSLVLGGVGVFYSKHYIEQQIAYYKGQLNRTETMVGVIVPKRDLVRGEILMQADISIREIPTKYADTNSVNASNFDVALGQRISFDLDEGRPLLWAHLEGGLTPTFSGKVPDGLRAMTVRVDEINSISGFLQPRDRVDLLMSYGSGTAQQIFPLIQQLYVIATGVQTLVDKNAQGGMRAFTTITVQVTPHEAQQITLAQQVGKLTAMLRNPEDESPLADQAMTVAELLGMPVPPETVEAAAPVRSRVRKPATPEPDIEYIIGGAAR